MSRWSRRTAGFFRDARITPGAMWLLVAEVGLSLVFALLGPAGRLWFSRNLIATDATVWSEFKLWTLVTSPFVEVRFIGLLFHGLMLWTFLPALEKWWGTRRFVGFALGTSAVAAAVGTLAGTWLPGEQFVAGLDATIFAGVVAYGVVFARSRVYFFAVLPMTGRQLAYGMVGLAALMVVVGGQWATGAGWAAAMLLALGLTSNALNPRIAWLRWRERRLRRRLKVLRGGADDHRWMN
ncbi:MAG: rhomboid family intramembrane serine protease [Deltaproteobacteria bacterium]|nr:MAG: rhomboid family intramembrane serine protease [Deltaproteobacteria bacterium]